MKRTINDEVEYRSNSDSENDVEDIILPEGPMCEEDMEGGRSFYRELSYNGRIIKLYDDIKVMTEVIVEYLQITSIPKLLFTLGH